MFQLEVSFHLSPPKIQTVGYSRKSQSPQYLPRKLVIMSYEYHAVMPLQTIPSVLCIQLLLLAFITHFVDSGDDCLSFPWVIRLQKAKNKMK